jgi:mRNA interferase MazF
MKCRRGDVVLVRYPDSNLLTYKKRPALVVQADNLQTGLSQRIVALITSNMARTGPSRVPVTKNSSLGQAMGLLTDSVVVTDNLATVLEREFDKAIGCCNGMPAVDQALRTTLNL